MIKEDPFRAFGDDPICKKKHAPILKGRALAGVLSEFETIDRKCISLERFNIALFHYNGDFFAIKDQCPHANYPLHKGTLTGDIIACASHNWQFNIRTGECVRSEDAEPLSIRTFEVEVEGDQIWIRLH